MTFLFTDIVGSTPLWEQHPDEMVQALQIHNTILRQAIELNGGTITVESSPGAGTVVEILFPAPSGTLP